MVFNFVFYELFVYDKRYDFNFWELPFVSEIIERLRNQTTVHFRPLFESNNCPGKLQALISKCWDESPECRPTLKELKKNIKITTE